jgi:hypothetical protein
LKINKEVQMARTEEKFASTLNEVKGFLNRHKKPVWLVPNDDGYSTSAVKPKPENLPFGTVANLYNESLDIVDSVSSSKTL